MITHDTQVRVRYGETDQMGFLYHAHYVQLFDIGRTELMRHVGIPNTDVEAGGVMLPVLRVEIDYRNPAHYDDLLTVRTHLRTLPCAKIVFDHEVFRPVSPQDSTPGELITTGRITLAFMRSREKCACRPPAQLLEKLSPYFI